VLTCRVGGATARNPPGRFLSRALENADVRMNFSRLGMGERAGRVGMIVCVGRVGETQRNVQEQHLRADPRPGRLKMKDVGEDRALASGRREPEVQTSEKGKTSGTSKRPALGWPHAVLSCRCVERLLSESSGKGRSGDGRLPGPLRRDHIGTSTYLPFRGRRGNGVFMGQVRRTGARCSM